MKLHLIRHGQSIANLGNWDKLEHIDTSLSERGHAECAALRDWLTAHNVTADVLYTSTLVRTLETAAYVEDALGLAAVRDDRIREVGHSFADGRPMTPSDLPKSYISNHPGQNPYIPQTEGYPEMESWMDARVRLAKFATHIAEKHFGETVYVVAHGGIIGMMIENVLNTPPMRGGVIHTDNTGISLFEYEEGIIGRQWVLRYHNQTAHLQD